MTVTFYFDASVARAGDTERARALRAQSPADRELRNRTRSSDRSSIAAPAAVVRR